MIKHLSWQIPLWRNDCATPCIVKVYKIRSAYLLQLLLLLANQLTLQIANSSSPWEAPNAKYLDDITVEEWIQKTCWTEYVKSQI